MSSTACASEKTGGGECRVTTERATAERTALVLLKRFLLLVYEMLLGGWREMHRWVIRRDVYRSSGTPVIATAFSCSLFSRAGFR